MEILRGKSVFGGIASGDVFYINNDALSIERRTVDDPGAEKARVAAARAAAIEQLQNLQAKAQAEVGADEAMIFEVHQMMLDDDEFKEGIDSLIESQHVNAEFAVEQVGAEFAQRLASLDDEYLRERAADIRDISTRLIDNLLGRTGAASGPTAPAIIAAFDLTPSQTIGLDKSMILAFVLSGGSTTSHTAILARTMGIPAIIGLGGDLSRLDGLAAVVDGFAGELYVQPDAAASAALAKKAEKSNEHKLLLEESRGKDNVTLDGHRVDIYSNIGAPEDVALVLKNDAGGVGLFRSEFVFLDADDYPTEEEQFNAYRSVVEGLGGKRVIIRTLDIGADKQVDYFHLDHEENPALGLRGLRLCLERPEVFATQLRAILRASAFGKASIMFPMVASAWEVKAALEAVESSKEHLRRRGAAFDEQIECGIMIETPAAAIISDELAPLVDFFSVGTNDLTQYTLAVDRQNNKIDRFTNTHHEAVLRLIELAAKNAHAAGKWIGICGELGADLELTQRFLKMGIDELSISPARTLELRHHVRGLRLDD
ncbi:MAG: phosphoenolpyruvate--protein phosphotransferase [Propionibacteriaceae bacterium]|jgi:phosphotransferase system enzyme I (PtsI)|nr:phosphoenolpyruvate--protein phosphotransferase [Propionibacteriaceae bacterium]